MRSTAVKSKERRGCHVSVPLLGFQIAGDQRATLKFGKVIFFASGS